MEKKEVLIEFNVYNHDNELPRDLLVLKNEALKATFNAYAPYSNFNVGAAIRFADGEIMTGANQENAAYPSGLCAERVVLFYAAANRPGVAITQIAITARSAQWQTQMPVCPCGGCLQVLLEQENRQGAPITIVLNGSAGESWELSSVKQLMPFAFSLK